KTDKIVVLLRSVTGFGYLYHVEPKLRPQVCCFVLCIPDGRAKFRTQLRIFDRDRPVDCGVAVNVRDIMRQGAQSECKLIRVLALGQQLPNEVSAANVMHQVAEFDTAKWIVAEIL